MDKEDRLPMLAVLAVLAVGYGLYTWGYHNGETDASMPKPLTSAEWCEVDKIVGLRSACP